MKSSIVGLVLVAVLGLTLSACQNQAPVQMPSKSYSLRSAYFDFDQSLIRSDTARTLQGNAGYLKKNSGTRVTIEGHCDSRGSNEYNLALGHRRAQSAKNYLVNMGVSPSRMKVVSYGEERSVCYENTESCWARNRRADFRK